MQKVKPWRSAKYRKWISMKLCSICSRPYCDPHHYQFEGQGVMGSKVSDSQCLPLCDTHHLEIHRTGRKTFAAKYNWQPENLIKHFNEEWQQLTGKLPG